jgi:hypothetical protein
MNSAEEFSGSSSHFEVWGTAGTGIETDSVSGSGEATRVGALSRELQALQPATTSKLMTTYVLHTIVDPP